MRRLHPIVKATASSVALMISSAAWHTAMVATPGDPIPDIDVVVEQHPGPRLHTTTDANGAFSFNLPAGTYTLRIGVKSTPVGLATRKSTTAPGAKNGALLPLPDSVKAAGGWPYALRLGSFAKGVAKIGLGVVANRTTPGAAQVGRPLEIQVIMLEAGVMRGSVETRE